jgi:PAS domain S-box-containing protein
MTGDGIGSLGHAKNELLRLSIDAVPAGIAMFDREMRYLAVSRRYREDLGIVGESVIGRCHYDLFPDIPERWREIHRRCLAGAIEKCDEDLFARADGTLAWYRWEIRPWLAADGTIGGIVLFTENVTRAVIERAELRRWADAFDNAAFGIAVGRQGTSMVDFANTAYAAMRGMTVEEVKGKALAELYPADELAHVQEMFAAADRTGEVAFETRCLHKSGGTLPIHVHVTSVRDAQANLLYRIVTTIDISRRRDAERSAREHEARLQAVMDHSVDGLITIDRDGTVTSFSRPAERMFGYGADEVIGRNVGMLMPSRGALGTADTPVAGLGRDIEGQRKDGSYFPVDLVVGEIPNEDGGGAREFVGAVRDITDRVEAEARLRQAQKMEAIGQLTGGLAHDFNNLLGVITDNLELAASRLKPDDRARVRIDAAIAAAWRGADLTRRLLAFARRQSLHPRRLDVNDVVAGTVKLLRRTLGEAIEIVLVPASAPWPVVADPVQLEACLMNLATNARDAMPLGGRLTITAENQHVGAGAFATGGDMAAGDYVTITVADTGTGMTHDVLARVFEPFFTTKEVGQGTGLGLSMVFGFIKQSAGHIAVESMPGAGTIIRLLLPRAAGEALAAATALPADLAGRGESVLVVEDNAALQRVAVDQLIDLGYRVHAVDGAPAALDLLTEQPVDLLFTDVVMPGGMDGFQLARRVAEQWPQMTIVLTSGFTDMRSADVRAAIGRPAHLLRKPYARDELARALRRAIDGGEG